jgi:23S rRNA (guanosine2251-2'-O)-methyltransferase
MSRRRPREAAGHEVVYGRNPVRELIAAGRRPAHEVWALPQVAGEPWLAGVPVRESTRDELGRRAGTSDHQGVAALTDPYPYAEVDDLLARPGPVVCLDGAHDPRNLGAIARVAECAAAAGLAIPRRGGPGVTPTVAKASAGAVEWLAIAQVGSVASFVHDARSGRSALGADPEGGDDYRAIEWPRDPLIVLGSEGGGLRPRVREACDRLVTIPTAGRVGSLNISVAAGILVFEALRNAN